MLSDSKLIMMVGAMPSATKAMSRSVGLKTFQDTQLQNKPHVRSMLYAERLANVNKDI